MQVPKQLLSGYSKLCLSHLPAQQRTLPTQSSVRANNLAQHR